MARQGGVRGWHTMRKDQLIKALLTAARIRSVKIQNAKKVAVPARRSAPAKRPASAAVPRGRIIGNGAVLNGNARPTVNGNGRSLNGSANGNGSSNGNSVHVRSAGNGATSGRRLAQTGPTSGPVGRRPTGTSSRDPRLRCASRPTREPSSTSSRRKQARAIQNLSLPGGNAKRNGHVRDRIVVMVRDSYWLHVYWELARQSVERAQAAMGQDWHMARPCLRLLEISEGGATNASERVVEDITIHGGVSNGICT